MAGATVATWVKVRTKTGLTSRPISHKYEGGANYEKGQTITQSEYNAIVANRKEKEKSGSAIAAKRPIEQQEKDFFDLGIPLDSKIPPMIDSLKKIASDSGIKIDKETNRLLSSGDARDYVKAEKTIMAATTKYRGNKLSKTNKKIQGVLNSIQKINQEIDFIDQQIGAMKNNRIEKNLRSAAKRRKQGRTDADLADGRSGAYTPDERAKKSALESRKMLLERRVKSAEKTVNSLRKESV